MSAFIDDQLALLKSRAEAATSAEGGVVYNLTVIRGIPQNPSFDADKVANLIDTFETKDGDVFIATFVKAGTTWTQQIVHLLLRKGVAGGFYGESVPWLEAATSDFLGPREAPSWSLESIAAAAAPRFFKTHATVSQLPRGAARIKTIVVARNPKDTAVSLFHHAKSKPEFGYKGNFEQFVEIFLTGGAENGSWFDHVLDWHKKCKEEPDVHLFLQYEEMYRDPAAAVRRIADFLCVDASEDVVAEVVRNASIGEMRESASIGLNHLRKGGYGGWRQYFSVATSDFFDEVYKYKMKDSGLRFNFGPDFYGNDFFM